MIFLLMGMTTPLPAKQTPAAGPLRVLSENPRYFTADGERAVYLTDATGTLAVEWFDPRGRTTESVGTVDGGGKRTFRNPFLQDAVLYLKVPL